MMANFLQSVTESGSSMWTVFCRNPLGDCSRGDCSSSRGPVVDSQLWMGSCSVHAITVLVHVAFLLAWSIAHLQRLLKNCGFQFAAGGHDLKANVEQSKCVTRVVAPRTRELFVTSIFVCAVLFLSNSALGLVQVLVPFKGGSSPPVHEEFATWILALAWLILTHATNSARVGRKESVPMLVRAWWVAAFILSLASLIPNISSFKAVDRFTLQEWLETVSIFLTAFLSVVAVRGATGVIAVEDEVLEEPLLGETKQAEEESPGVTPYATAGLFSQIWFSWLNPLLAVGAKKTIDLNDLPLPAPNDTSEYNYLLFKRNWESQTENNSAKSPSLLLTIGMCFWRSAAFNAVLAGVNACVAYVGPYLINDFVEYLAGRRRFVHEGTFLIVAFTAAKLVETVTERAWYMGMQFLGLHFRAAMTAFVYKKGLRLSNQARQGHTAGEIINYVSVDVDRISLFSWYFHSIWVIPLQVVIALLILYRLLGNAAFSALAASIFVMVMNTPLVKLQDSYQDKLMAAKDKRMKSLTECLRSMSILKLQTWETKYLAKLEGLRLVEYRHLRGNLLTMAGITFVFWTAPMFVAVATFGTCALQGTPLTAGKMLSALATFRVLQEPLSTIPDLISMISQTKVSLDRLQKYLLEEELQDDAIVRRSGSEFQEKEDAIEIDGAELKWDPSAETPTLHDINLHVKKGQRVAICGTVGSGKSSLLSCILGEIPRVAGSVKVSGTMGYVAQAAWIQSCKIEENILFGSPMDRRRYEETIRACALEKDIDTFPHGDQTLIGERGINMSGGQKQRIQLARAVYQDADIYLLDDPFSAVDSHTGSHLFQSCILGALRNKTVLYVTHQVEFLPAADLILVFRGGKIVQAGKYDELLRAGTEFETLVNAHNEAIELMGSSGYKKEDEQDGATNEAQDGRSQEDEMAPLTRQLSKKKSVEEIFVPPQSKRQLVEEEERERGSTSFAVYWAYITAVYKGGLIPLIILAQLAFQLSQIASNYWMASATPASPGDKQGVDNKTLILVYCALAFVCALFSFGQAILVSIVGLLTAQKFFTTMLRTIFRAPMSFFDSTPTGRILARASSDQNTLESELVYTLGGIISTSMQLLGIIVVMSQITWQMYLLFIPLATVCIFMQRYYIKTAREVKRLMGILKSPILHHYGESIAGVVTIRGFGQQERFLETNLDLFDKNIRATFHNFAATQWLMMRLEMFSTFLFAFSLFYCVNYIGHMDAGLAGLAVTYGLQLNSIQTWWIWIICNMENRIISVERIIQFTRIQSEAPLVIEDSRPPAHWPWEGTIQLRDLQVRYNTHSPLVLHGISCTFAGGHKIGVVGRTGSGKTTLIQTLFRLVEPSGGQILIDGIDICNIGLHDLRQKLSIIPQDPTLFEGTMRDNLDPLQQHSDAEVWEALDQCQLGDTVRAKEGKLDCPVNENGENWSVGQRQLVCLGRALLKQTTILVLDEATASVDSVTDAVIQRTLHTAFQQCTVITVAHRIPTVIDSDCALVLSDGKIAEYDPPNKLLEDQNSLFYKLVAEYSTRSRRQIDDIKLDE